MATETITATQGTGETRIHYIDWTYDLPTGVTVSSGTAIHTPPSGSATTPTVGTAVANIMPVTVGPLTAVGKHIITVNATLSDAEIITARLVIPVEWTVPRTGLAALIAELRGLTEASIEDYTVAGKSYWTDSQLQEALDRHAMVYDWETLTSLYRREGTAYVYKVYESGVQWWEDAPLIYDYLGGTISSSLYSFNQLLGRVTFAANQSGSARMIGGTAYDLNAAAGDVWRTKASHYAAAYDMSTDNHNLSRSQLYQQALKMAGMYASMSLAGGGSIYAERGDTSNG